MLGRVQVAKYMHFLTMKQYGNEDHTFAFSLSVLEQSSIVSRVLGCIRVVMELYASILASRRIERVYDS